MILRIVSVALVGAVTVACGGPGHNAADARFAAAMVPHHALGVRMADTALARADNVLVRRLAFQMTNYQQAELSSLTTWQRQWPTTVDASHVHGMLTAEEETRLASLSGVEFDRTWLTEMIRHHEGAVQMSEAQIEAGKNPGARAVAERIIDVQEAQIDAMRDLLTRLDG